MPSTPPRLGACTNCSRSKAKCVWPTLDGNDDAMVCQRCSRSNLLCSQPPAGVRRRRGKAIRTKVIEQKLDDIMTFLSRGPAGHICPNLTPAASSHDFTHCDPSTQSASAADQSQIGVIPVVPGFQVTFSEADLVLEEFRAEMVPQFPFVILPTSTAYDLIKDKPLLLKTILWACRPPGPDASAAFERWFRQYVAHQTVVLVHKSLEILQALLVFLAWGDIHFYANAKDSSLVQLALGLAGDLGLTKRPDLSGPASGSLVEDAAQLRNNVRARAQHTSDDRRAVLGVYYITSILSGIMGRPSRLEYAPYFDYCCTQLLQDAEASTDPLLVNLVRLRRIANKVHDTFPTGDNPDGSSPFRDIHALAIASVQKELDLIMNQLPDELKWNHLLRSHCAATRIRLFEPAIHDYQSDKLEPLHSRSQFMWDCLKSAQLIMDTFLSAPVESYLPLTFASMLHLALAIIKTTRVLLTHDHDWDLGTARSNFKLEDALQQLSDRFETCSRLGRPRCMALVDNRPYFAEYAGRFRWMKGSYLSKIGVGIPQPTSTLIPPVLAPGVQQQGGFEFWKQLSDMTYGAFT